MQCPTCGEKLGSKWRAHNAIDYILFFFYVIPISWFRWIVPRLFCKKCSASVPIASLKDSDRSTARVKQALGLALFGGVFGAIVFLIVSSV